MRSSLLRAALVAILLAAIGCQVTDADIDHWKRTQRGPGKITAVLVGTRFARPLRVHAARALIEMKHPNANGLELLNSAMASMPPADREAILHDLLPSLRNQMRGVGQQTDSGPSEPQMRAKDAGYLLLRYASGSDRDELSNLLLDWILADLNTRALAGQYTSEQIVEAIGRSATDRLLQAYSSNDDAITVSVQISQHVNRIADDAGKDRAVARLITISDEILSSNSTARMRESARRIIARGMAPNATIPEERLASGAEYVRGQYLALLWEAIKVLNRPRGSEYLISIAANPSVSLERRKLALAAVAGQVQASHAPALLAIATNTQGTDLELRGAAIDRVGETSNRAVLPQLWQLFDTSNGGEQNQEYLFRWKIGEAILKLGGGTIVPEFVRHLTTPRVPGRAAPGQPAPTAFEGYTYREINGYALTLGDLAPPPTAAVRALLGNPNMHVKALALLYLATKGEASDLSAIEALMRDATPMQGPGWASEGLSTLGAVAIRARQALRRTLNMPELPAPAAPTPPASAQPAAARR